MPSRGEEDFTVLLIPHSARPMSTVRLSSRMLQICCVVIVIALMSLTVFAARYTQLVAHLHELQDLRTLTSAQEEQLRALTATTNDLTARLNQLAALDSDLRAMLKLEAIPDPTGGVSLATVDRSVTMATGPSSQQPQAVQQIALDGAGLLADTGLLAGTLDVLQLEMEQRLVSLQELQVAAAEHVAYQAARPSIWPTQGVVTSRYGYRSSPTGDYREFHPAIDISAPLGTPVVATGDAVVALTGWQSNLGNTVILDHGYNFRTVYGHVAKVAVSVGDRVKRGQVIAYVGSTGRSTGPHVHYEVHLHGKDVNPAPYLQ
jgi:murein DD-endopeptidase MepM/ murein hydrolase activator NlpD